MAYEVDVSIKGVSPLLQHRFPEDDPKTIKKSSKRTGNPDYSKESEISLYKLPNGTIYQPATHIEGCLKKASVNFQIAGKRRKTYKDLVLSAVFVKPDAIPHKNQKWVSDERPVIVPSTRGRIIRSRPRFDNWNLDFTIQITDSQLPFEVLKEILDYAGNSVGIGDFRPRFGRFIVTKFDLKE